jgi:hypothetical protein
MIIIIIIIITVVKMLPFKTVGGVEMYLHPFLRAAVDGYE